MTRPARMAHLLLLLPTLGGCSVTSRQQLADCRQRVATLQTESDQLRNETLTLRNRNRDLAQRAVEDARRLRDVEEDNRRLETSIASFQEDRRAVTEAFQQLQQQVIQQAQRDTGGPRASATPAIAPDRFEAFARAQAGSTYDPDRNVWTFATGQLFETGSADLSPRASLLLDAFARLLDDSSNPVVPARVVGRTAASPVRQTSATAGEAGGEPTDRLARDRAGRIAQELARRLGLPASAITIATEGTDGTVETAPGGVAVELRAAGTSPR